MFFFGGAAAIFFKQHVYSSHTTCKPYIQLFACLFSYFVCLNVNSTPNDFGNCADDCCIVVSKRVIILMRLRSNANDLFFFLFPSPFSIYCTLSRYFYR